MLKDLLVSLVKSRIHRNAILTVVSHRHVRPQCLQPHPRRLRFNHPAKRVMVSFLVPYQTLYDPVLHQSGESTTAPPCLAPPPARYAVAATCSRGQVASADRGPSWTAPRMRIGPCMVTRPRCGHRRRSCRLNPPVLTVYARLSVEKKKRGGKEIETFL